MSDHDQSLPLPLDVDPASLGRVVVLMGGRSSERQVSLMSGQGVLQALRSRGVAAEPFDPATSPLGKLESAGYDRASSRCMAASARTARSRAFWR